MNSKYRCETKWLSTLCARHEQSFRLGWRLICRTWQTNRHCLILGSGRWTLAYWINKTCCVQYRPAFYRQVLMEACSRGWAIKSQSSSGHSAFTIRGRI